MVNIGSVKASFVIIFFLFGFRVFAEGDLNASGARSAGIAHASLSLNDVWSAINNQAGLVSLKQVAVGVYYENRFSLKELSLYSFVAAIPVKSGTIGMSFVSFGYAKYRESKTGIGYATTLGKIIQVGLQLDYFQFSIPDLQQTNKVLTFEFGLNTLVNKDLILSAHIFNPLHLSRTIIKSSNIPSLIRLGLLYSFSDQLLVTVQADKDLLNKASVKIGIEYQALPNVVARTGISTNPLINSFGIGMKWKRLIIDMATSIHQVLGIYPQMSVTYKIK